MVAQTVLATLPGSGPNERLLVALAQRGGRLMIELREQHYAEGIGWFDQRTMALEPRQFRQLQAVLGVKAAVFVEESADEPLPATIPFPGPRTVGPHRPAVGDGC
jgi:hypothetical protein